MSYQMPVILGAGLFDSRERFPKLTVTTPRRVEAYELEYFYEDGGVSVMNGREYPIKAGSLLLAKPGDIRCSRLPFTCKFVHFRVTEPRLAAALEGISSFYRIPNAKKAEALVSSVISLFYSANPFDNIAAAAELITLVHLLGSEINEGVSIVLKAQKFIQNNFRGDLSTNAIAAACDISVPYLHKLFRSALNTTPGEYLLSCRLGAARDMLINTDLPLQEIASSCGFNSQSYFSDCFKKNVGISPRDYRRNATYLL